jgi:hypothetical protein
MRPCSLECTGKPTVILPLQSVDTQPADEQLVAVGRSWSQYVIGAVEAGLNLEIIIVYTSVAL